MLEINPVGLERNPDAIHALLGKSPVFGALAPETLHALSAQCEQLVLASGHVLIRQGDAADYIYMLVTGRLRAWVTDQYGSSEVVGDITPGEVVGEMALLTDEPRSATVRAVRDSELISIPRSSFMQIVAGDPGSLLNITRMIVKRLRRANQSRNPSARPRTLAIVPVTDTPRLKEFASQLAAALDVPERVLRLDHHAASVGMTGYVAEDANPLDTLHDPLTDWLNVQERKYTYVVYEAESKVSRWTRRCLRQADLVLLLHDCRHPAPRPEMEAEIAKLAASAAAPRIELVILRAAAAVPGGTPQLLARYHSQDHHHVGDGVKADFRRLCRLISGQANALVLSGGGARGFAHIGVIRGLVEAGIEIDYVGGTSIGSIVAGKLAQGATPAEIRDILHHYFVARGTPISFTFPAVALSSGARVSQRLREAFGEDHIEDLALHYFCVSGNLTQGRMKVHDRGCLWRAMRASASIPGILPPVRDGDDLLVDGGVVNNMPVDIMRQRVTDSGRIVSVDVMSKPDLHPGPLNDRGIYYGGLHLLQRVFMPRRKLPPRLASILLHSSGMGELHHTSAAQQLADVVVRPDVSEIGMVEWDKFDSAVEAGYVAVSRVLEQQGDSPWPVAMSTPEPSPAIAT